MTPEPNTVQKLAVALLYPAPVQADEAVVPSRGIAEAVYFSASKPSSS